MFSFFRKKVSPDKAKIDAFTAWFASIHDELIASYLQGDRMKYLDEVETHLAEVYRDGYKGEVEFQYGYDPQANVMELLLFHGNRRFLVEATAELQASLAPVLGERWKVTCEK